MAGYLAEENPELKHAELDSNWGRNSSREVQKNFTKGAAGDSTVPRTASLQPSQRERACMLSY